MSTLTVGDNKVFTSVCLRVHPCYLKRINSWLVWWHDYKSGLAHPWWSWGQRRGAELLWSARTRRGCTRGWPVRAGCMGRTVEVTERKKNVLVALFWLIFIYNVYFFKYYKVNNVFAGLWCPRRCFRKHSFGKTSQDSPDLGYYDH